MKILDFRYESFPYYPKFYLEPSCLLAMSVNLLAGNQKLE